MLLKTGWNKFPPACLASYLKDLLALHMSVRTGIHLCSLHEEGWGKNASPLWLRKFSKKKKIFHGECYPCLQERKQEPPGPDRAGTKSKPKRKWLRPASGCGGFSLVVVPSRLQPLCHHKPRRYWTDRVFHKIVLTHKQWLTETVKWTFLCSNAF